MPRKSQKSYVFCAIIATITLLLTTTDTAYARRVSRRLSPIGRSETFGVGFAYGSITGATLKYWISHDIGIAGTVWYEFDDYLLHSAVDCTYQVRNLASFGSFEIALYFGGGVAADLRFPEGEPSEEELAQQQGGGNKGKNDAAADERTASGDVEIAMKARAVAGASVLFRSVPVEVYAEFVPFLPVHPNVGAVQFGGTVGARYYF